MIGVVTTDPMNTHQFPSTSAAGGCERCWFVCFNQKSVWEFLVVLRMQCEDTQDVTLERIKSWDLQPHNRGTCKQPHFMQPLLKRRSICANNTLDRHFRWGGYRWESCLRLWFRRLPPTERKALIDVGCWFAITIFDYYGNYLATSSYWLTIHCI